MGELNIEKVDESKFVPAHRAVEVGYYGYTPDDTDDYEYTVAAQGPIAEAAAKGQDVKPAAKPASKGASK